ncbi:hypothetical protein CDL12_10775 [Handroanthus impetiginosus]|uniref:Uncharacterized protein n=1 Tax=Handroanthus impetiginosus TaxID=429701 RepID=A0A2G9HG97_9LAMI|nr:hypothetical protein CDL12_10775 [Handroanthus impetiginosus]
MDVSVVIARILLLTMISSSLCLVSADTRIGPGLQESTDRTHMILRKLGFDGPKLEYYRRRAIMLDAGTMRTAPGGPEAQHHSKSPTLSSIYKDHTLH